MRMEMGIRVLQRCNVFGFWPEDLFLKTEPFTLPYGDPAKDAIGRICVRSYKSRPDFGIDPKTASDLFIHAYPELERSTGFYIGEMFYSEKIGDPVGQMRLRYPLEGQVDIYLEIEYGIDLLEASKDSS